MSGDTNTGFRSPLGRVRGLGPAHGGGSAWLSFRLLSVAYVPLVLWFVISVVGLAGADYATAAAWLKQPLNAILMLLTLGVTFHHAAYGMQEVFEDYVHVPLARTTAISVTKGACLVLAVASAFAVLKIAFAA